MGYGLFEKTLQATIKTFAGESNGISLRILRDEFKAVGDFEHDLLHKRAFPENWETSTSNSTITQRNVRNSVQSM